VSDIEREIERIEQGGEAWEETDEVVEVDIRRPLDTVVPVRLAADTYAELRREARARGVGPSTLIRMWILEKLHAVSQVQTST
jgi:hypothetical protein